MQTRKKSARRGLLVSATSLLLCVAMLVGTTFAWFTDSVSSGTNKIQAGNLDIEVKHTNANVSTPVTIQGDTKLFCNKDGNAMQWEPGAVSYETFTVSNEGTLALKYNLKLNITDYNAVSETTNTLKDVLKVKVLTGSGMMSDITRDNVGTLGWGEGDKTLDTFSKEGGKLYPAAEADQEKPSKEVFQVVVYWMPTANDNDYNVNNGKTTTDGQPLFIDFGINVVATQLQHENDSFGSDYDNLATLPNLPASINKTFTSAKITTNKNSISVANAVPVSNASTGSQVATIPAASAKAIIQALADYAVSQTGIADDSKLDTVFKIAVTTDNNAISENSVTYDISLIAEMTYKDTSGNIQTVTTNEAARTALPKPVCTPLDVGKGLTNVQVYHNNSQTAMTMLTAVQHGTNKTAATSGTGTPVEGTYYDPDTGILYVWHTSCSPFKVTYEYDGVAVMNNKLYSSLQTAIDEANDGDTISLIKDMNGSSNSQSPAFTINKGITLNGNGHTVTVSGNNGSDSFGILVTNAGRTQTTIENLVLRTTGTERAIRFEGTANGVVKNTTIEGTGVGIHVKGTGDVDISDTTITITPDPAFQAHKRTGVIVGSKATATVSNSTITVNTPTDKTTSNTGTWGKGVYVGTGAKGKLIVENSKITADYALAIDGSTDQNDLNNITVKSGVITGAFGSPSGYSYKEIVICGGSFKNFTIATNGFNGKNDPIAKLIISGGTFDSEPDSKFIADNFCVKEDSESYVIQPCKTVTTE